MACHAEDALRGTGIAEVFNLALAVPASEAISTEGLVASQDGQVLDLVAAVVAAVGAVVAYEGAVAEEEQVGIGVEERVARVAAEAVDVPSVAGWSGSVCVQAEEGGAWQRRHTEFECFAFFENLEGAGEQAGQQQSTMWPHTSPQPLQG